MVYLFMDGWQPSDGHVISTYELVVCLHICCWGLYPKFGCPEIKAAMHVAKIIARTNLHTLRLNRNPLGDAGSSALKQKNQKDFIMGSVAAPWNSVWLAVSSFWASPGVCELAEALSSEPCALTDVMPRKLARHFEFLMSTGASVLVHVCKGTR